MKSSDLKEAIDDIRKSRPKTIVALAGLILIATVSGILLYRFYSEEETCSGTIIPAGKGLLEEIAYIEKADRFERENRSEEWPLFFDVVTNRGGWGDQEKAWIASLQWIDGIAECGSPRIWQDEGIYPTTRPPEELVDYQYEGNNPPSQKIVSMMNDYFREISDEVDWSEHLRYQGGIER